MELVKLFSKILQGNPFFQFLTMDVGNIFYFLIDIGGYGLLIALFMFRRETQTGVKREAASYLMMNFIGALVPAIVSFFVPFLSIFFMPLLYILVLWEISRQHGNYNFFEILIEFVVFLATSLVLSLLVAIGAVLPSLLIEFISPVLAAIFTVIVRMISAYIVYIGLYKYTLPFAHRFIKKV